MKIKIKDFKGIYTNTDENDNRLEYVQDSENFYHRRGFLEIEPRRLSEYSNLPDPNADFPSYTWTFETAIYTTLSSDILTTQESSTPYKFDVIVLIAKATEGPIYHRLVYIYNLTESIGWYELSRSGNYYNLGGEPAIDLLNHDGSTFDNSFLSTTIDGKVHFQVEDGRLKLYFPHDTFWLGKINRKIWVEDSKQRVNNATPSGYPYFDYEDVDGKGYWYIDRIVDHWDHTKQYVQSEDDINIDQSLATIGNPYMCSEDDTAGDTTKRRMGIIYNISYNEDATHITGGRDVNIGATHDYKIRNEAKLGNLWAIRVSVYDKDTGVIVRNPNLPYPAYPEIFLWAIDADRTTAVSPSADGLGAWDITESDYPNIYIHFTEEQAGFFTLSSGAAWSTLSSYQAYTNNGQGWFTTFTSGVKHSFPSIFSISLEDFYDNTIQYGGDLEVGDIGWQTGENKFSIIATALLDEREEIPLSAKTFNITVSNKYVIKISNIELPWNISKRITRLRFYHGLKDGADLEMVKEFNLLRSEDSVEDFEFSAQDYTGDTLAGNTGFLWDYYDHPGDLQIVNGFQDFVTESGISIGIASKDKVAIYYSTFGGGNLMPDLVYHGNRLPLTGVSELTAVANADGRLMAFTPNTSYVIKAQEIAGVVAFSIEDTVEVGVKDKFDVANIQGGVLVHTQHGIYVTNGYETQLISEPIDDIIRANYSTGRIYYNRYKHEVYYKPSNSEDLYRYRMKDNVWERNNKTITTVEVKEKYGLDLS